MGNDNPNPKHTEALEVIPKELHHFVIPIFKKWDQSFVDRVNEIKDEYKAYDAFKPFIENKVDPRYVLQAVQLADALQDNPQAVIDQMNEAWDLGYVSKEEVEQLQSAGNSTDDDDDDLFGDTDIENHPTVKAMKQALDSLQTKENAKVQQEREEAELKEFESYMDGLEQKNKDAGLPFNRRYVTALISQGLDGDEAVKQYHEDIGNQINVEDLPQANNNDGSPVVMGEQGTVGGGTADGSVDFGGMTKNDLNTSIENLLQQRSESGQ